MNKTFCERFSSYGKIINYSIVVATLVCLYFTTSINYLLFHSLSEIFSIVVAFSVFVVAWNSQKYIQNQYLLFIGIAFLFIGFIDLLHTLAYKGMPIFTDYDFYANQLWIGARYVESISLLAAFYFLNTRAQLRPYCVVIAYTGITIMLILSIFTWKVFPECFVENKGLTFFKIISEYIICLILALNVFLLAKNRGKFESVVFHYLLWALIFSIIAELSFTFYISNYGLSNLIGHYFKIVSFFMVYLAIIKTSIENPYDLIFRELDNTNKKLNEEIVVRKEAEEFIKHMANHDALTDLPSLRLTHDRLSQAINAARRNNCKAGLLFIDLDGFKMINDSLGHNVGDVLLKKVAHRLVGCVREMDTVGRIGGDEFLVVVNELDKQESAAKVAEKIIKELRLPFNIGDEVISIGASIGISIFPDCGEESETLIKQADTAMYSVKHAGRNNYAFARDIAH